MASMRVNGSFPPVRTRSTTPRTAPLASRSIRTMKFILATARTSAFPLGGLPCRLRASLAAQRRAKHRVGTVANSWTTALACRLSRPGSARERTRLRNIDQSETRLVARLTITLLGDFEARIVPGPPLRLRTRKAQALLAYLALPAGQTHSRDKLATLLWGDEPPAHGRARLRESIFALRKGLAQGGQEWVQTGGDGLALSSQDVDVDVAEFERLVRDGTPTALEAAATLYRGDLLQGFTGQAPDFEEWLLAERERLRELALEALARLLAAQWDAGAPE